MISKLLQFFSKEDPHDWVTIDSADVVDIIKRVAVIVDDRNHLFYFDHYNTKIFEIRVCLKTGEIQDEIQAEIDRQVAKYNKRKEREEQAKAIYKAKTK